MQKVRSTKTTTSPGTEPGWRRKSIIVRRNRISFPNGILLAFLLCWEVDEIIQ